MSFTPLDFVTFKNVTQAERDAEAVMLSLTAMNISSGFLESWMYERWAQHVMLSNRPVSGDTLVYEPSINLFVPTPASRPIVERMLIYNDGALALEVKRIYKDNVKTPAGASTGELKTVGLHTLAGSTDADYAVEIDSLGSDQPWDTATFRWSDTGGAVWNASGVPVASGNVAGLMVLDNIELSNGVNIIFSDGTYDIGDRWDFVTIAANNQVAELKVDTTGGTGVTGQEFGGHFTGDLLGNVIGELATAVGLDSVRIYETGGGLGVVQFLNNGSVETKIEYDPSVPTWKFIIEDAEHFRMQGGAEFLWPLDLSHNFEAIYHQFKERTTPGDPAANYGRFYAKDVGGLTLPHWKQGSTERAFALEGASPTFDDLNVTDDLDVNGDADIAGNLALHGFTTGLTAIGETIAAIAVDVDVLTVTSAATGDDPTTLTRQGRVTTTDATVTTINTIATTSDTVITIEVVVRARRTGGTAGAAGDSAGYLGFATFKNIAGVVTAVGTFTLNAKEDQTTWNVTVAISGTNILIQVTGAANNNITWHSEVKHGKLSS